MSEWEILRPKLFCQELTQIFRTFKFRSSGSVKVHDLKINENSAATVVMVSGGYPETYEKTWR
ncbi:MAG: hypothetical protein CM15mP121_0680 [Bacteroidota bacterium]|nr:MAG: hypothetical protein CM15mP121_0680 [Bacteroidota bacterium]